MWKKEQGGTGAEDQSDRSEENVDEIAEPVAGGRRPKRGNHQVRTAGNAQQRQRLTEVGLVSFPANARRWIEDSSYTRCGVDQKAPGRGRGILPLALEQVVDEDGRGIEVGKETTHGASRLVGDDKAVDTGDRIENPPIEHTV